MSQKAPQIPDERFSCQSCGRCCRRWTITLDEAKVEQLRRVDWSLAQDPFIRRRTSEGDTFRIRMRNGRCVFLDENNRCLIHTKAGYEAKPAGCKAFPLLATRVAGETRVRLSFYCPAVTAGQGKRLHDQRRWVQSTIKAAGDITRQVPLQLDSDVQISGAELEVIESTLLTLLQQTDHDVGDRLAAGGAVLDRLQRAIHQRGKGALQPTLKEVRGADLDELAREGRDGASSRRAGPVFSLFLGNDCGTGTLARLGQFFRVRLSHMGLLRLGSHLMQARASRRAIQRVCFDLDESSAALLTRYLTHKLRSRRILSGELTLVSGFALLTAAFGVLNTLARLKAAAEARDVVHPDDITLAVQAADLLVMEHAALHQGSVMSTLTETVLNQERLYASILSRVQADDRPGARRQTDLNPMKGGP